MPKHPTLRQIREKFPRGFGTVVFDCDSTLSAVEGIDELAGEHREQVSALTDAAMRGEIPLEDAYGQRLDLIRPTRSQVNALGQLYVDRAVEDAGQVMRELAVARVESRIITGGLRPAVLQLTRKLGVPDEHVAAVDVYFEQDGRYAGFDDQSPLTRAGGKLAVLKSWASSLPRPIMVVGDGATDLETRPAADLFVAYAGVAQHLSVIQQAAVVIYSQSLAPVFLLASGSDRTLLPSAIRLLQKGAELMEGMEV